MMATRLLPAFGSASFSHLRRHHRRRRRPWSCPAVVPLLSAAGRPTTTQLACRRPCFHLRPDDASHCSSSRQTVLSADLNRPLQRCLFHEQQNYNRPTHISVNLNEATVHCRLRPRHPLHDVLVYSRRPPSSRPRRDRYDAAEALTRVRRRNDVTRWQRHRHVSIWLNICKYEGRPIFGDDWTCGFGDILADRYTDTQTDKLTNKHVRHNTPIP